MVKCVIVLEIKDQYVLAMEEGGAIIRIQRKAGLSVGDKIYVLPEDIYQEETASAVIPFTNSHQQNATTNTRSTRKIRWGHIGSIAAMFAIIITLLLPQISPKAYAYASLDGSAGIQIELDKHGQILSAISPDDSIAQDILDTLAGKNIDQVGAEIRNLCGSGSILIGYVALNAEDDDALYQAICSLFVDQPVVSLRGEHSDIQEAEKQSISLGKYLLEQQDKDVLDDIISSLPDEEQEELYQEKPEWIKEELHELLEENQEAPKEPDLDDDPSDEEPLESTDEPDGTDNNEKPETEDPEPQELPDRREESEQQEGPEDPEEPEDPEDPEEPTGTENPESSEENDLIGSEELSEENEKPDTDGSQEQQPDLNESDLSQEENHLVGSSSEEQKDKTVSESSSDDDQNTENESDGDTDGSSDETQT